MPDTSRTRAARLALAALLLAVAASAQAGLQPPAAVPSVATVMPAAAAPQPPPPLAASAKDKPPPIPLPKIDPRAALKDLLPAPPKAVKTPVYTGDDLRRVPELRFESAPEGELTTEQWQKRKAHTAAAALHLNAKEEDGFLKAMLKGRTDLAGVPFAMGDACRSKRPRAAAFKRAVEAAESTKVKETEKGHAAFMKDLLEEDNSADVLDLDQALIAARRQRMAAANLEDRQATVRYFAGVSHPEATRELARMAVFSPQEAVRKDALQALSVRREKDYTEVLVEALNYPWPAVARNASEAIAKLDRKDLMPNLIDMLDAADPRGPKVEEAEGKKVTTARELVRVNHHSNCMLCHAPAEREKMPDEILSAEVAIPSEPLPPSGRYSNGDSNILVRIDVTYLRQDFSAMQAVDEKGNWPAVQRFDFVVRKRELSAQEADELRDRLEKREPGVLSPYQKAAVDALRKMTGRDFKAKAEPWRRHLKLKGS